MAKAKIALTLGGPVATRLDRAMEGRLFPNRSQTIEGAVLEKLERLEHRRLAAECAKLDPDAEQALAEEAWRADGDAWPGYGEVKIAGQTSTWLSFSKG